MASTSRSAGTHVDWRRIEDELSRVGAGEFDSPSFDSLPHVLALLSESDVEVRLEQLKRQQGKIESHVNAVIEEYHNGFNGALQNFSRILGHFENTQRRIEGLRSALEDSRKRLGSRTHHLHAQWRKSITLSSTVRLMDDISSVAVLPDRIRELEGAREWTEAAQVLLEGCRALARDELRGVGGLANVRKEMARRRLSLQQLLIEELQSRVYAQQSREEAKALDLSEDREFYNDAEPSAAKIAEEVQKRMSTMDAMAAGSRNSTGTGLRRTGSMEMGGAAGQPGKLGKRGSGITLGSGQDMDFLAQGAGQGTASNKGSLRRRNSGVMLLGGAEGSTGTDAMDQQRLAARRISRDLGDMKMGRRRSSMDLSSRRSTMEAAMMGSGRDPGNLLAEAGRGFEPLVNCLVSIGGGADAKAALRDSVPSRIRDIIRQALEKSAKSAQDRPHSSVLTAATLSKGEITRSVPAEAERSARAAVQAVLDGCDSALRNLVSLQHMVITEGNAAKADAAVEFVKQELGEAAAATAADNGPAPDNSAPSATSSVRSFMKFSMMAGDDTKDSAGAQEVVHEAELTWAVVMRECEAFLKDVLNPSGVDGRDALAAEHSAPAGAGSAPGTGRMTFSFDVIMEGLDLAGGAAAPHAGQALPTKTIGDMVEALQAPPSYRPEVVAALGHEPSTYFASALYRPVVQFVDTGNRSVDGVAREASGSRSQGKKEASKLRHFFEGVVTENFLPRVRVDIRARCNAVLEDEEMFRPRARFKASYEKDVGKGRPVLGAALAIEQLMGEVMGWAANMPLYAPKLSEVAEGLLGRLVDAFTAVFVTTVRSCQSASAALACRGDFSNKMAAEGSAALLQDTVKFYVPKKEDEFDSRPTVTAIDANGLGSSGEAGEAELLQALLKEPPVDKGALLLDEVGDISRVAQLAALSDTLEYIAEVVEVKGGAGGAWTQQKDSSSAPKNAPHHRRSGSKGAGRQKLPDGLAALVDRCLSLSGRCLRTLRLELMIIIRHNLQELLQDNWISDDSESIQAGERLGLLTRSATRLEDAVLPFLPKRYRMYVFGPASPTAARILRALLPDMPEITPMGIERVSKVCGILQPIFSALGTAGESAGGQSQAGNEFELTRKYYGLLNERVDSLIKFARERSTRYSPSEYLALLEVHVPGRNVTDEHRVLLAKALGREKGRKVSAARSSMSRHHQRSSQA